MKTRIARIAIAALLVATVSIAQTVIQFGEFTKTPAAADPPESLTSTNLMVWSVTLKGIRTNRVNNTGTVYVGFTTNNDTQLFPITAGGEIVIQGRSGTRLNLKNIYLDVVTVGDGVQVFYE